MYQPLGQFLEISHGALLNAGLLRGGVINAQEIILAGGTNGVIRSQNYNPVDELGWAIYGDGSAFFYGDVFFGDNAIFLGDIYSSVWDGTIPANLATVDSGATAGYYLDSSAGAAQFVGDVFVGSNITFFGGNTLDVDDLPTMYAVRNAAVDWSLWILGPNDTAIGTVDPPSIELWGSQGSSNGISLVAEGRINLSGSDINLPAGSVALPSLIFGGDVDTGLYLAGTNWIGFSAGGSTIGSISSSGAAFAFVRGEGSFWGQWSDGSSSLQADVREHTVLSGRNYLYFRRGGSPGNIYGIVLGNFSTPGPTLDGQLGIYNLDGTASLPSYSFYNDTNSGLYHTGSADNPALSVGGTRVQDWHLNSGNPQARYADGLVTHPSITFIGDSNTGIHHPGADIFGITAGGVEQLRIINGGAGSSMYLERRLSDVGNHETLRLDRDTSAGLAAVGYFSSWEFDRDTGERRKDDILSLADSPRWDRDWFQKIRPVDFRRISTGEREFGFILDEWVEVDDNMKYLTTKGDKWGHSPHETAILAAAVLEIQDLHRRVIELEAKLGL